LQEMAGIGIILKKDLRRRIIVREVPVPDLLINSGKYLLYTFRYFITGVSMLKFPVLSIRTCEPVTFVYTSG
jgi:hypothetical protein